MRLPISKIMVSIFEEQKHLLSLIYFQFCPDQQLGVFKKNVAFLSVKSQGKKSQKYIIRFEMCKVNVCVTELTDSLRPIKLWKA